jgi:hypothetical protein
LWCVGRRHHASKRSVTNRSAPMDDLTLTAVLPVGSGA